MDERLKEVINLVIEQGYCSTSQIQRKFMLGYNRTLKIIEQMEKMGIVGKFRGSKPRKVLIFDKDKINSLF